MCLLSVSPTGLSVFCLPLYFQGQALRKGSANACSWVSWGQDSPNLGPVPPRNPLHSRGAQPFSHVPQAASQMSPHLSATQPCHPGLPIVPGPSATCPSLSGKSWRSRTPGTSSLPETSDPRQFPWAQPAGLQEKPNPSHWMKTAARAAPMQKGRSSSGKEALGVAEGGKGRADDWA